MLLLAVQAGADGFQRAHDRGLGAIGGGDAGELALLGVEPGGDVGQGAQRGGGVGGRGEDCGNRVHPHLLVGDLPAHLVQRACQGGVGGQGGEGGGVDQPAEGGEIDHLALFDHDGEQQVESAGFALGGRGPDRAAAAQGDDEFAADGRCAFGDVPVQQPTIGEFEDGQAEGGRGELPGMGVDIGAVRRFAEPVGQLEGVGQRVHDCGAANGVLSPAGGAVDADGIGDLVEQGAAEMPAGALGVVGRHDIAGGGDRLEHIKAIALVRHRQGQGAGGGEQGLGGGHEGDEIGDVLDDVAGDQALEAAVLAGWHGVVQAAAAPDRVHHLDGVEIHGISGVFGAQFGLVGMVDDEAVPAGALGGDGGVAWADFDDAAVARGVAEQQRVAVHAARGPPGFGAAALVTGHGGLGQGWGER